MQSDFVDYPNYVRLPVAFRENPNKIWFSSHLLDKFLTLDKINKFLLFSFNRNFRTFVGDFRKGSQ